jgi:hypothetical protein
MDEPIPPTPPSSAPPASFDSIIVPPEPPPPSPSQVSTENVIPPVAPSGNGGKFGKKLHAGPIVATLLLLLITLPLSIMFIANRNQLSDVRSRADALYPTCPSLGGACAPVGAQCDAEGGKGYYCCVKSISGSITWQPKTWATCPADVPSCPWTETNGQCCPSSVDACDYTAGGVKCIADPFNSHCVKWGDGSCPGGGGRWAGVHYYTDCTTEGCGSDSNLTCVRGADGKQNLCRNVNCPSDTDCVCGGTPPPTTTITPTPGGQCDDIKIYKNGTIVTDLSSLAAGDVIAVWVKGTNATKARVRMNGGAYTEATISDNTNTWYIVPDITIPGGVSSIVIESEVFVNSAWK